MTTFTPSEQDAKDLVLAWMNRLSVSELQHQLWDYPGDRDYGSPGYGVGEVVARRIVLQRTQPNTSLASTEDLLSIPGFGPEKLEDVLLQASEAIALSRYLRSSSDDPLYLWYRLQRNGPGLPLVTVARTVVAHASNLIDVRVEDTALDFHVPVVALERRRRASTPHSIADFPRVRVEPWAFAVHRPHSVWTLQYSLRRGRTVRLTIDPREAD